VDWFWPIENVEIFWMNNSYFCCNDQLMINSTFQSWITVLSTLKKPELIENEQTLCVSLLRNSKFIQQITTNNIQHIQQIFITYTRLLRSKSITNWHFLLKKKKKKKKEDTQLQLFIVFFCQINFNNTEKLLNLSFCSDNLSGN